MAAAGGMPIDVRPLFSLPALGITPENINFRNLTMTSDKAIAVRDESDGKKVVVLVDTLTGRVANRMPMAAEAATLSPDSKVIAVRAGGNMQIYNLELQKKIKSHKMPEDSVPVHWTWVNSSTIGIVTASSVYHWSAEGDSAPAKMFDRNASLSGTQIISYASSADGKWLMLVGIKAGAAGGPAQGCMQLYSVERKVTQPISSHAGCFTTTQLKGREDRAILFCFVERKPGSGPKLHVIEVGRDKNAPGGAFRLTPKDLPVPAGAESDFAVSIVASAKTDIIYIVTKMGYVYLFDLHSGEVIFRNRFSQSPVFSSVYHEQTGGVMTVSVKEGQVTTISVNENNLVPYILNTLRKEDLAVELSARLGLSGADDLYKRQFESKMSTGDYDGAAKIAASAPGGVLRTNETIERFKSLPPVEGRQPPILKYFATLMEHGKLNKTESVELARPALQQGRGQLLDKWLNEKKIECSEELGDMVAPFDSKLAMKIYMQSGEAHQKVMNCFLSTGEWEQIIPYARKHGFQPNYLQLLQNMVHQNPKAAQDFAIQLVKTEGGPLVEIPSIVDVFSQFNRLQECTSFLLDVLAEDRKDQGFLQTKLLEMNLLGGAPQVVDAILGSDMFHHFDKQHIAELCERAQLYQRALELYTETSDMKRVLRYAQAMNPDSLVSFFGNLSPASCLECLDEMLSTNPRNLQVVVRVATQYSDQLTPEELIKLFEAHKSYEGLYYYLGGIVNTSENAEVHFKYIVAAANLRQFKEVERVCRDSTVYNAEQVKDFLLDAQLADPRPLIHVCDRNGYVEELTSYLFKNKMLRFVEVYVQKVSPDKTPLVVGKLLDLDCEEDFIKNLLNSVGRGCPVEPLVEQVEQRNRLRLLQPWLEQRVAEGNTEAATHNAIGKIYITLNKEPQQFLRNNQFYDSLVIGRFCEKLDPYLAYLAYRRAGGACDEQLIEVTNENGLFKDQARYLVERQDPALWSRVLSEDNQHRRQLIDQVTGTALPETKNPEEVSVTVKAFMAADLPNELIGLLEKLVLQGSDFAENRNLQNLLVLTAIKCAHEEDAPEGRTMEYINRLDNFDGPEIAKIALKDEYQLYEEGFAIYKKFKMHVDAVKVLIEHIENLPRAAEFAERVDESDVWSCLAEAQLDEGMVTDAINSFIKANDPSAYNAVIQAAEDQGKFADLVRYLRMARQKQKERVIDSEIVYALAQCGELAELETFITSPNVADIQSIGDRCFDEQLYAAAKLLFAQINNNAQLARCLVHLGSYKEAVDAAKKANSLRTWKEVNAACVSAGEFRLAQIAGLQIIMSPDHLEELVVHYEKCGHTEELIKLMEQGVGLENAHQGIFTELGVLYSKYKPDKLMEHIKIYWSRVNVSRLLRACSEGRHWEEAAFLYTETGDFDMAVRTMMEHSPSAFNMDKFLEIIQKVRNQELYYRSIDFFLEEQPMQLEKLLRVLTPKLDHSRVVHQLRKNEDQLPLIMPYLKSVQKDNLSAVNEAINEIYVNDEDYESLRQSVDEHDNFDQIALAQRIEKHELLEFRRIAALLFKRNKRWEQSITLSKSDSMYQDAIETAAESKDTRLAEDLLRFFVEKEEIDKEAFCACLFTCYDLVRPDVALELGWRHRILDFAMPYLIQFTREVYDRLDELENRTKPKNERSPEEEAAQAAAEAAAYGYMDPNVLQIANYAYNPQPGMGGMDPTQMGGMPQPGMGGMPQPGMGGMPQPGMGGMPQPGMGGMY